MSPMLHCFHIYAIDAIMPLMASLLLLSMFLFRRFRFRFSALIRRHVCHMMFTAQHAT